MVHQPQPGPVVQPTPMFKWFVIINLVLCFVTLILMVAFAAYADDKTPKMRENVYNACETVFKMTAGAFLGLLAGKGASHS